MKKGIHRRGRGGRREKKRRGTKALLPSAPSAPSAVNPLLHPSARLTIACASSTIFARCSGPRKLSAYSLYTSSVPDGRAANQPFAVVTFSPPIAAPLPGALVSFAVIGSPASPPAVTASGDSAFSFFFSSGLAG